MKRLELAALSVTVRSTWVCVSTVVAVAGLVACTAGGLFRLGPRPAALVGVWIDSALATPSDTVAWVLTAHGNDRTLHVVVTRDSTGRATLRRSTGGYGYWYLHGELSDTAHRALCFKARPRDGGSCYHFRLDTLITSAPGVRRRRLRVLAYRGRQHTRDRILIERLP